MLELVDHPSHYGGDTPYEAIKVIEAWNLNFRLGSMLKYIRRIEEKDSAILNLEKARWYLDREIAARILEEALNAVVKLLIDCGTFKVTVKKRKLTKAGKAAISAAQKKRWANIRRENKKKGNS
jgi:hypothetical protein